MKKLLALLLALLTVVGMCAGCNSIPEETKAPTDPQKPAQTPPWSSADPSGATGDPEASEAARPADGIYFKMGLPSNATATGLISSFASGSMYLRMVFETLLTFDTDMMEWVPHLAESYEVSDDGLTWTVELKRGHKFHDGKAVTADDVVFTYNWAIRGNNIGANLASSLEGYAAAKNGEVDTVTGITRVDKYTVQFKLAKPDSLFINALANTCFSILPEHLCKHIDPTDFALSEFWAKPIGSGAFKVGETRYPDYVVLEKVPDYYRPAGFDKVLLRDAGEGGVQAGEYYSGTNIDQEAKELLEKENADLYFFQPNTSYRRYLEFNFSGKAGDRPTHPSIANARVRKALGMLIDKEAITELFGDTAIALTTELNPNHYLCNNDIPAFRRDVETARVILDAEGFDYATPIRLYSDYTDQTTTDMFELIKQNWAEAGVILEYTQDENWELYFEEYDYDIVYNAGMSVNVIDFWKTLSVDGRNAYTEDYLPDDAAYRDYVASRYDALVDQFVATTDPVEQRNILFQLQAFSDEDMFRIPLYCVENYHFYNAAHVSGMPEYARDYESVVDLKLENWMVQ